MEKAFLKYDPILEANDPAIDLGNAHMLTFLDMAVESINSGRGENMYCFDWLVNLINGINDDVKSFIAQPDYREQAVANYEKNKLGYKLAWRNYKKAWKGNRNVRAGFWYATALAIVMDYDFDLESELA